MRKPIGIALKNELLHVVCDDGAVFRLHSNKWQPLLPVPGTKAASEWQAPAPAKPKTSRARVVHPGIV